MEPKKFGDLVNMDHIIAHSEESAGLTGELYALLVVDRYSGYLDVYPRSTKSADDAYGAIVDDFGKDRPIDA